MVNAYLIVIFAMTAVCMYLLCFLGALEVPHTYREQNKVADKLATINYTYEFFY